MKLPGLHSSWWAGFSLPQRPESRIAEEQTLERRCVTRLLPAARVVAISVMAGRRAGLSLLSGFSILMVRVLPIPVGPADKIRGATASPDQ